MKDPALQDHGRSGGDAARDETASGVSRRLFLKGSGLAAAATALSGPVVAAVQESKTKIIGPDPVAIRLTINGEKKELELEPRVTLLDALRNHLDMTGAKKVCDRGTCGACTVMLDGKPVYSCSVLAIDAQGKQIKTIEGLGADHAMVKAFVDNDAEQCGFCTPGFVMACTAFAGKHANPSLEEIEKGLGGNLCRCGTYMGIKGAVQQAAKAIAGKGGKSNA